MIGDIVGGSVEIEEDQDHRRDDRRQKRWTSRVQAFCSSGVPLRCCWAMAPVDTDNDNRIRAKKNLRIVFFHFDGRESNPNSTWHNRDRLIQIASAANRSGE